MKNLPDILQENTVQIAHNEISIYTDRLTSESIIKGIVKIKKAFPSLPIDFYEVFDERINENRFTDQRLKDAINNVIDNCIYPVPTIANFISFDKRVKVFTYDEMVKKCNESGPETWNNYKGVLLPGNVKKVWIHINDIEKYKIESL
jgi:hypothetical protein